MARPAGLFPVEPASRVMKKGDETRQRIIEQAASLFNQHGFEGSSMAALMTATGLEKGGIYRHFSSKEQLAIEAFNHAWDAAFHTRMRGLAEIANSVDRLNQFITNFAERRPPVSGGCPLLNTAVDADDGNPLLRLHARKALRQWRRSLVGIIRAGIKAKEIRPAVDATGLATLIISSLEGALMVGRLDANKKAVTGMRDYLHHYLEREVRAPSD